MWIDAEKLANFYHTPLGQGAQKYILKALSKLWPNTRHDVVVGYGYGAPFLDLFRGEADRVMALMPAPQGAIVWPRGRKNATVLVEETLWPLEDNSVDKLLIAHALEFSDHGEELLQEAWRVLKPEGEILVLAPNRRGIWSHFTKSPFGYGTPYTGNQLFGILESAGFFPDKPHYCLYMLPARRRLIRQFAATFERIGFRLWRKFGGVVMCRARKRIVGLKAPQANAWRVKIFNPLPTASTRMDGKEA